jgi:hypothetical protein
LEAWPIPTAKPRPGALLRFDRRAGLPPGTAIAYASACKLHRAATAPSLARAHSRATGCPAPDAHTHLSRSSRCEEGPRALSRSSSSLAAAHLATSGRAARSTASLARARRSRARCSATRGPAWRSRALLALLLRGALLVPSPSHPSGSLVRARCSRAAGDGRGCSSHAALARAPRSWRTLFVRVAAAASRRRSPRHLAVAHFSALLAPRASLSGSLAELAMAAGHALFTVHAARVTTAPPASRNLGPASVALDDVGDYLCSRMHVRSRSASLLH